MLFRDLKKGDRIKITGLEGKASFYRQRLIALGLIPGTLFTVTRVAPLGDPIEISVRGFLLSLRKDEAAILKIEPLKDSV